jgi:hypothetical protein
MHRFLGLVLALLAAALPARSEEPADSIQAAIVAQLDAFQANDLTAAFAHASPMIQSKFGTPEVFGRAVETGYPVIWRPARHEMLALLETTTGRLPAHPARGRNLTRGRADMLVRPMPGTNLRTAARC